MLVSTDPIHPLTNVKMSFMVRLLCVLLAVILLMGGVSVSATEDIPKNMALLELGSAAEGSTLNYYVLRAVVQYCDAEGICNGKLFDGLVFAQPKNTDSREEVQAFMDELTQSSGVFSVVEQLVIDLKDGGFLDKSYIYPLFVAFPNVSTFALEDREKEEFCRYYADTLFYAVEIAKYKHIALAGVYFDDSYSGNRSFKNYCMSLVKEKGLLVVESTSSEKDALSDRAYSCYGSNLTQGGAEVYFAGVPTAEDGSVLADFLRQVYAIPQEKPLLFTFEAFNNLYDCASALSQNEPNENGRQAYECINSILSGDYDKTREVYGKFTVNTSTDENDKLPISIIVCIAICVAGLLYIVYILVKKGKK